ncbi:chaperonin 10-like protein [Lineolata rhizophorae]|uniref:Chaperonin 10-like protein n=1 Tax=Lineolata rhizophorae TaxID=578093 RepID=A0A6A6NY04_9PEZI|nr:chaperonin 10-like protein [Lineolata rhizophorae]
MATHQAALLTAVGSPLTVQSRPTPTPGPKEIVIAAHSVALNPVDYVQRDMGMFIENVPAVLGSDLAGTIAAVGPDVTQPWAKPGARVLAFATAFYARGAPDFGAFQERVRVPAVFVTPLPDGLGFREAAMMPMAVGTTWAGFHTVGHPRAGTLAAEPGKPPAMLVWGASSSVGSGGVQVARLLGYTVYATAGAANLDYVKNVLGAARVFDHRSPSVVDDIVAAVQEDGVSMQTAYIGAGDLAACAAVMARVKPADVEKAMIASAPLVPPGFEAPAGVEARFVMAPTELEARHEFSAFTFNQWLKEKLEKGEFVPSPGMTFVEGGLGAVNGALDQLKAGVSGTKIVLDI